MNKVLIIIAVLSLGAAQFSISPNDYQHLRIDQPTFKQISEVTGIPNVTEMTITAGKALGTISSSTAGSCFGACHSLRKSGYPVMKFPVGGESDFDIICLEQDPNYKVDIPGVNARTYLNLFYRENILNSAITGGQGVNANVDREALEKVAAKNSTQHPGATQLILGSNGHEVGGLAYKLRNHYLVKQAVENSFGAGTILTDDIAKQMMLAFELAQVTDNSPMQQWVKGEIPTFRGIEGLETFHVLGCQDCHSGQLMGGEKLGTPFGEHFADRAGKFGIEEDNKMLIPTLASNLWDAPAYGLRYEYPTLYQAIKAHNQKVPRYAQNPITPKQNREIVKLFRWGMLDQGKRNLID